MHLADYNNELRQGPESTGPVDVDLLVSRLRELGVTVYYWLIWHAPTDWEDLKKFLPLAAAANIRVWVYLAPKTEPPPSQPFGLDFERWGKEIATLSLTHLNLTGWVIDDFRDGDISPDTVQKMQWAAKQINFQLGFFPLLYDRNLDEEWLRQYLGLIDGAIVAFPGQHSENATNPLKAIEDARELLMTSGLNVPMVVMMPGNLGNFHDRYGDPATPEKLIEHIRVTIDATKPTTKWETGMCHGIVTYCIEKSPDKEDDVFRGVRDLYRHGLANE